jgi:hypothetical protein
MTYTRAEVAERAGVDPAFVDRLCDFGILRAAGDAFTEGDVRRAGIVHSLDASGLSIEGLAEAIRGGHLELGFAAPGLVELKGLTEAIPLSVARRAG